MNELIRNIEKNMQAFADAWVPTVLLELKVDTLKDRVNERTWQYNILSRK